MIAFIESKIEIYYFELSIEVVIHLLFCELISFES